METCKFLISGPFSSGKTTFIKTISEIDIVSTEKDMLQVSREREIKENTTVAMDFGRITIDETLVLYIFGTPGARRFDFMWEIFAEGILGYVFMVDSRAPETFREAQSLFRTLIAYSPGLPCVFAANFHNLPNAWDIEALRIALRIPNEIPIIPCIATDRESVKGVMIALLNEVLKGVETDVDE
jgi:uncharacterized protein